MFKMFKVGFYTEEGNGSAERLTNFYIFTDIHLTFMESQTNTEDFEIRNNIHYSLVVALGFTAFLCFSTAMSIQDLNWQTFNAGDVSMFVFLVALLVGNVFAWMTLADRAPVLKFTDEGFWTRKKKLPFSEMEYYQWADVSYFYILWRKQKGNISYELVIGGNEKVFARVGVTDLDIKRQTIIKALRRYTEKYKITEIEDLPG